MFESLGDSVDLAEVVPAGVEVNVATLDQRDQFLKLRVAADDVGRERGGFLSPDEIEYLSRAGPVGPSPRLSVRSPRRRCTCRVWPCACVSDTNAI